jgi:hypothetical protein
MKGWLDNFGKADNANESNVSMSEDFIGLGYNTKGRNYSPAWGGQFQDGGMLTPVSPLQQIKQAVQPTPTVPYLQTKDPAEFYKSWIQSPEYARRQLLTGYSSGEDLYMPNAAASRESRLGAIEEMTPITYSTRQPSEAKPGVYGSPSYVNINPSDYIDTSKEAIQAHELAHIAGAMGEVRPGMMSAKEQEIFKKSMLPMKEPVLSGVQGSKEREASKRALEDWKHSQEPDEAKADLDALRFMMYDKGIYDITKGKKFTESDFEKAKQNLGKDRVFKRLTDRVGKKNFVNLMNTIALADDEEAPIAMGGMSIPGSVGFTYARVAGAAPSKGKYAKKTMASAQNGIIADKIAGLELKMSPEYQRLKYLQSLPQLRQAPGRGEELVREGLATADIATDLMQVGNFIPHPMAQGVGKAGNILGSGVDLAQALMSARQGDYLDAAINLGSVGLAGGLASSTFRRNSKYLQPGQPLYALSPQAFGSLSRTNYIEPFRKVGKMTDKNLLANRALLGLIGAETVYDAIPQKEYGGDIPSAQNGQEMRFYQNGLDWKPKSMQEGGKIYEARELPEFVVEGKDDRLKQAMYEGSNRFLQGLVGVIGSPQTGLMEVITGKQQTPSQAFGFQDAGGWLDSPKSFGKNLSNLAMDVVLDPINLLGVGIADDIARTTVKGLSKKAASKELPSKVGKITGLRAGVTAEDVNNLIDKNINYIESDEYLQRRMATTGESKEQVLKDVSKYKDRLKNTTINLSASGEGGLMDPLNIPYLTNKKIKVGKGIADKEEVLGVLDHEIKHMLSPASEFPLFSPLTTSGGRSGKYFNYPELEINSPVGKYDYFRDPMEQQVRMLKLNEKIRQDLGIKDIRKITGKEFDSWKSKHLDETLNNPRYRDFKQIYEDATDKGRSDLLNTLNRLWAAPAIGVVGAQAIEQKKDGGFVKQFQDGGEESLLGKATKFVSEEISDPVTTAALTLLNKIKPLSNTEVYKTVRPVDYPNALKLPMYAYDYVMGNESEPLKTKSGKPHLAEEFWATAMNIPGERQYLKESQYKPSKSKDPDAKYYTIRDVIDDYQLMNLTKDLKPGEKMMMNGLSPILDTKWYSQNANTDKGVKFDEIDPLQRFTLQKSDDGSYISIYDKYDFNNPALNRMMNPIEIYDRFYLPKKKDGGGVVKDDNGYLNPDNFGKVVEIDSNIITMEGVNQPLLGISDTGDTKLMKPGKNYKFKGKKVTEFPVAKLGINQLDAQPMKKLNQLLNFTNNPDKDNWLDKYN